MDYTLLTQNPYPANFSGKSMNSIGGLQRQGSGSSFAESSFSGDHDGGYVQLLGGGGGGDGVYSSLKSWAQQTEEGYQLQLALALRLSSEASFADDPKLLDPVMDEAVNSGSSEALSHRFWANGCLSYPDKIPDGFYFIHGMDPYVWSVCSNPQESGRIPSLESLKAVNSGMESSFEVIMIDRLSDFNLREMQNHILNISYSVSTPEVVDHVAKLVCNQMGGAALGGENELLPSWKDCSDDLKQRLGSVTLPIGSLSIGLCRHRAILFKVLADSINLPCRIAKGCKYCKRDDASSCLVRSGIDKEFLVDLVGNPGCLYEPDSLINGPSSISIFSPLRFPRFKHINPTVDFESLAKQYFVDCDVLNLVFEDPSTETNMASQVSNNDGQHRDPELMHAFNRLNIQGSTRMDENGHLQAYAGLFDPRVEIASDLPTTSVSLDVDVFDIPWTDMILKEKIGEGSFGTVHRADWNGEDVAVKTLSLETDFHPQKFDEFWREVAIMRRLQHPNIVLFMGVVTQPPNLSIVTEYLPRGSLFRLLHRSGPKKILEERHRLRMALDVIRIIK